MHKYTDLLGIKYAPHGRSKQQGFDCYGLAIEVLRRNGIRLRDLYYESVRPTAEFVHEMEGLGTRIEVPEPNCVVELLALGMPRHIGVYIGDGMIIHATRRSGVVIEPLRHYKHKVKGYYRVDNQHI